MDRVFLLLLVLLLLFGWHVATVADRVTTALSSSGSAVLSSSVAGEKVYANYLFTDGDANISRSFDTGDGVVTKLRISGAGPIGFDEYAEQVRKVSPDSFLCLLVPTVRDDQSSLVSRSGLFDSGEYVSAISLTNRSSLVRSGVNGSGMLFSRSKGEGRNESAETYDIVSGYMRLVEDVSFGDEA